MGKIQSLKIFNKTLSIVLLIAILICIAAIILLCSTDRSDPFTEFYLLGPNGKANDYPTETLVNEPVFVIIGITNRENEITVYNIKIEIEGSTTKEIQSILLKNNEKQEIPIGLTPTKPGDHQKVEFLLYRQDQENPYLNLHLWLDVKSD